MNNGNRKIYFQGNVVPRIYFTQLRCNLLYWWNKVKNCTRRNEVKENERLPKVNQFIFPSKLLSKCVFLSDENTFTLFLRVFKPFALFTRLQIKQPEERRFTHVEGRKFRKIFVKKNKMKLHLIEYYKKIKKAVYLYFKNVSYSILCCFLK